MPSASKPTMTKINKREFPKLKVDSEGSRKWGDEIVEFDDGFRGNLSSPGQSSSENVDVSKKGSPLSTQNFPQASQNHGFGNNQKVGKQQGRAPLYTKDNFTDARRSSGSPQNVSSTLNKMNSPHGDNSRQLDSHNNTSRPYHEQGQFDNCKVFVGGLHYETTVAEFRSYFEKYGKVSFAEVMYARETRKPRGFGFVVFQSEQVADKVCNEGQHVIDGKSVEVKRAVPRPFIRQGQQSHTGYPERRDATPVVTQPTTAAQPQSSVQSATQVAQSAQQQAQQQPSQTAPQMQTTTASSLPATTQVQPQHQQVQLTQAQQQHQLFQHHIQQIQQQHMQQQHPHSLSPQHSPHHHQQYTHQQMQHFQQLHFQQLQQYQRHQQHHNPYMQGQPILMAPLGIPDMSYATDMMVDDQGVVYDSMDNMHMDNTSKNSSLDVPTDMDTVANSGGEGSGYGKLEMSEQALREEMSEWIISNVKIVRKVAERYVSVLFDAEVGSIDRLKKKLIRFPAFLRDLGFDLDDCDDLIAAVFNPPPSGEFATGNCSPTSSSSYSSIDVVAAVNNMHVSSQNETGVINANVAATAVLANALSLGNGSPTHAVHSNNNAL